MLRDKRLPFVFLCGLLRLPADFMSAKDGGGHRARPSRGGEAAIQVICLGSAGGPSEQNCTGLLVRSTASKWTKGSLLAVDAGSHLAAIIRILENEFPLMTVEPASTPRQCVPVLMESPSPGNVNAPNLVDEDAWDTDSMRGSTPERSPITLKSGPFAGLPFPHASARANAIHVIRDYVSTYMITHPHIDHLAGFVINTAGFHMTTRPKRLAALPFTVNAIKTHIFNDIVWPNMTDEDGGVGFVTFQRLTEGGNIALGEGHGRGYIEVCDRLATKAFKVSHGHCMKGPGHVHRGSDPHVQPEMNVQHSRSLSHPHIYNGSIPGREGRSVSFSAPSQPGTPTILPTGTASQNREPCVVDSSAYFIREEASGREILIFGDVEPDTISLTPRNHFIWAEAAPKVAAGILSGVFIECSYNDTQSDATLFGHLAPRHLIQELQNLAGMVQEAKKELERERAGKKRKRTSNGLGYGLSPSMDEEARRRSASRGRRSLSDITAAAPDDVTRARTPEPTPSISMSGKLAGDEPLSGLKVVIIHVKDTLTDGPLVGDSIAAELRAHEARLAEKGQGLGCEFVISESGRSYWF